VPTSARPAADTHMSGLDKPLYLVMHKDQWVTRRQMVGELIAVPAFGSESEAWDFARETCREHRHAIRDYRVVEFVYAGAFTTA
jgi:hypothetical protein